MRPPTPKRRIPVLAAAALAVVALASGCSPAYDAANPPPRHVALAGLFVGGPLLDAPPSVQVAAVRKAQDNLRVLGYYRGSADGEPSPALDQAIRAYQRSSGFRPTGRLDRPTASALDLVDRPYPAY